MKKLPLAAIALTIGLAFAGAQAKADDAKAPAKPAAAAAGTLTAADVKTICDKRAKGDATKLDKCTKNHADKIGKPIGKRDAKTLAAPAK